MIGIYHRYIVIKQNMKKIKYKNLFLLTWKKIWLLAISGFISIILHNLTSGLLEIEEAFFFTIAIFIIPAYFLISVLFTLINFLKNKKGKKK